MNLKLNFKNENDQELAASIQKKTSFHVMPSRPLHTYSGIQCMKFWRENVALISVSNFVVFFSNFNRRFHLFIFNKLMEQ